MKVAHAVKRIEMIDDDIKQLKKLENQLKKGKTYSNPIMISIEKQINILLAERIKYLELRIENPPALAELEDEAEEKKEPVKKEAPKTSRLKTRKKKSDADNESGDSEPDDGPMLTQDMIDEKFDAARKKILEDLDEGKNSEKKKGNPGNLY